MTLSRIVVVALLLVSQTPQPQLTPAQILDQLGQLIKQLQAQLAQPAGVTVTTSAELTAALKVGGAIRLQPGTYAGNFVIAKASTLTGGRDAILTPVDLLTPALRISGSDVTVTGITVKNGAPDREAVVVGDFNATTVAQQPARVTLDGISVEAGTAGGHRGIALHGVSLTVKNSRVTGFWERGRDAQAVWIHNGPGPYTVIDNYLEASGENILTGGETVKIPNVVPTGVVIARNVCYKPDAWRTNGATVKNGIEIKNGRRVLIEDNLIDGNWRSGQDGNPIVLTVRNQNNDSPWVIVDEITVRGNKTVRCKEGYAIGILGYDNNYPSQQTQTILVEYNLFTDSPGGFKIGNGVAKDLTIRHNTLPAVTGSLLQLYDERPAIVKSVLTFTDNVAKGGEYGVTSSGLGVGLPSLNAMATVVAFHNNVIEKTAARGIAWPPGNTLIEPGLLSTLLDPVTFKLKTGTAGVQ